MSCRFNNNFLESSASSYVATPYFQEKIKLPVTKIEDDKWIEIPGDFPTYNYQNYELYGLKSHIQAWCRIKGVPVPRLIPNPDGDINANYVMRLFLIFPERQPEEILEGLKTEVDSYFESPFGFFIADENFTLEGVSPAWVRATLPFIRNYLEVKHSDPRRPGPPQKQVPVVWREVVDGRYALYLEYFYFIEDRKVIGTDFNEDHVSEPGTNPVQIGEEFIPTVKTLIDEPAQPAVDDIIFGIQTGLQDKLQQLVGNGIVPFSSIIDANYIRKWDLVRVSEEIEDMALYRSKFPESYKETFQHLVQRREELWIPIPEILPIYYAVLEALSTVTLKAPLITRGYLRIKCDSMAQALAILKAINSPKVKVPPAALYTYKAEEEVVNSGITELPVYSCYIPSTDANLLTIYVPKKGEPISLGYFISFNEERS